MIDHLIFIFYLYFFLFSTIGYGIQFSGFVNKRFLNLDLGWYGIIGFFLICIISIFSSFITAHNFLHNIILHFFGIFFFFLNILNKKNFPQLKFLFFVTF